MIAIFNGLLAGALLAARRSGRGLPERRVSDFLQIAYREAEIRGPD